MLVLTLKHSVVCTFSFKAKSYPLIFLCWLIVMQSLFFIQESICVRLQLCPTPWDCLGRPKFNVNSSVDCYLIVVVLTKVIETQLVEWSTSLQCGGNPLRFPICIRRQELSCKSHIFGALALGLPFGLNSLPFASTNNHFLSGSFSTLINIDIHVFCLVIIYLIQTTYMLLIK